MKKKYFVIVALVLAAAVIFFPDFSFAGEDRIDIGSVTNNSVLIGMDVFQLGNTASFTRDNVFALWKLVLKCTLNLVVSGITSMK